MNGKQKEIVQINDSYNRIITTTERTNSKRKKRKQTKQN